MNKAKSTGYLRHSLNGSLDALLWVEAPNLKHPRLILWSKAVGAPVSYTALCIGGQTFDGSLLKTEIAVQQHGEI